MNRQRGERHWTHQYPDKVKKGTAASGAKLSQEQIEEICQIYRVYRSKQTVLARRFGISRMTVWRHLKAAGLIEV